MPDDARFERLVAGLYLLGGVVVAGYAIYLETSSPTGGVGMYVFAAVALIVFGALAGRAWRRAERLGRRPEDDQRDHADPPTLPAPPTLSPAGRDELARVVGVLAWAGLFAPAVPDVADLEHPVADAGEPVTCDAVLAALDDAPFWHPERVRPADHHQALAHHGTGVEQDESTLRSQLADLARLVGDALTIEVLGVEVSSLARPTRVRLRLRLGGEHRDLDYLGDGTSLSTVLHVTVARALGSSASRRLAWLWSDQGVWVAALRAGVTVADLNTELSAAAGAEGWTWVDDDEPWAAGDR